jgi:transcriptional regulator with XRE-family HTH domain
MILVRRLLGDVLRGRRQRSGRTLRQLAATARVSPGYLSEVERGQKEPSSELLAAICDALEVKLSDVLLELSTELAAAELAAELEAAEIGTLLPPGEGRTATRVPMPSRSGESAPAGAGASRSAAQRPVVVGAVGTAAPRRAGTLPTAKIPTAVINSSPLASRPGNRPASGGPVRTDPRVAPKRAAVPPAALGPQAAIGPLPYTPGGPLPGPENPYTFGTARVSTPTGGR